MEMLPDNLVVEILKHADAKSIISFSSTCKRNYKIAQDKAVCPNVDLSIFSYPKNQLGDFILSSYFPFHIVQHVTMPIWHKENIKIINIMCPELKSLNICGFNWALRRGLLIDFPKTLKRLIISCLLPPYFFLPLLKRKFCLSDLKHVVVLYEPAFLAKISHEAEQAILARLPHLETFSFGEWKLTKFNELGEALGNLVTFELRGSNINDDFVLNLARNANRLQNLNLSCSFLLTDSGIKNLVNSNWLKWNLHNLNLMGSFKLTDAIFNSLKLMKNLRNLDLRGTNCTAEKIG